MPKDQDQDQDQKPKQKSKSVSRSPTKHPLENKPIKPVAPVLKPKRHIGRTSTVPISYDDDIFTKEVKPSFKDKVKNTSRVVGDHLRNNWRKYALGAAVGLTAYKAKKRYWDSDNPLSNLNLTQTTNANTNTNKAPVLSPPDSSVSEPTSPSPSPVTISVPPKVNSDDPSAIQSEKEVSNINRSINLPVTKSKKYNSHNPANSVVSTGAMKPSELGM